MSQKKSKHSKEPIIDVERVYGEQMSMETAFLPLLEKAVREAAQKKLVQMTKNKKTL